MNTVAESATLITLKCVSIVAALSSVLADDCVMISVLHDAAVNAPVDDLCTRPGVTGWAAAAGEGRTVIGATGILVDLAVVKYCCFFVVVYQLIVP